MIFLFNRLVTSKRYGKEAHLTISKQRLYIIKETFEIRAKKKKEIEGETENAS